MRCAVCAHVAAVGVFVRRRLTFCVLAGTCGLCEYTRPAPCRCAHPGCLVRWHPRRARARSSSAPPRGPSAPTPWPPAPSAVSPTLPALSTASATLQVALLTVAASSSATPALSPAHVPRVACPLGRTIGARWPCRPYACCVGVRDVSGLVVNLPTRCSGIPWRRCGRTMDLRVLAAVFAAR